MSIVMMGGAVVGHGSSACGSVVSQSLPVLPVWVWTLLAVLALSAICGSYRAMVRMLRS